jgi:hypothetical protein
MQFVRLNDRSLKHITQHQRGCVCSLHYCGQPWNIYLNGCSFTRSWPILKYTSFVRYVIWKSLETSQQIRIAGCDSNLLLLGWHPFHLSTVHFGENEGRSLVQSVLRWNLEWSSLANNNLYGRQMAVVTVTIETSMCKSVARCIAR